MGSAHTSFATKSALLHKDHTFRSEHLACGISLGQIAVGQVQNAQSEFERASIEVTMITIAVGDVHGCHDKLTALLARCRDYADGRPHRFVFIGDYIDRGPDSRGVLDLLIQLQASADTPPIFLRGNHEQMFLDGLRDSAAEAHWFSNGGDATLASYGAFPTAELPATHIAFIERTQLSFDDGQRFFVHAGINPDRPLTHQDPHDLLWIRQPFLSSEKAFGRLLIHGHSPVARRPDIRKNRVNIDTAAVFGGPLTAAVFVEDQERPIEFIQTRAGGRFDPT
jgi:serine/threonine protein phosphatase 1